MNAPLASPIAEAIISEACAIAEAVADELIEAFEREMTVRAAECVRQWEMNDPRDRWRQTGEAPPPLAPAAPIRPAPYRTPQATIDAFFYVASLNDADHLKRWLEQHSRDAETLCKLWEGKNAAKA